MLSWNPYRHAHFVTYYIINTFSLIFYRIMNIVIFCCDILYHHSYGMILYHAYPYSNSYGVASYICIYFYYGVVHHHCQCYDVVSISSSPWLTFSWLSNRHFSFLPISIRNSIYYPSSSTCYVSDPHLHLISSFTTNAPVRCLSRTIASR